MGEMSISKGLVKAIGAARHFLYIEDQYFFFHQETYDALRRALGNNVQHLILLIQYPQELPGLTTLLWKMWFPLYQEFPEKVHAFYRTGPLGLDPAGIYIHSK